MKSHSDTTTPDQGDERRAFDREVGCKIDDAATRGIAWMAWQAARALSAAQPVGYALISIDALRAWGKLDEVRDACKYPLAAPHPSQGAKCATCGGRGFIVLASSRGEDEQEACPECNPQYRDDAPIAWVRVGTVQRLREKLGKGGYLSTPMFGQAIEGDDDRREPLYAAPHPPVSAEAWPDAYQPAQPVSAEAGKVEWVDGQGGRHAVTIPYAAELLKQLFDEWPDGVNEIEAALRWRDREIARLTSESVAVSGEVSDTLALLVECRDAFPVPPPGSPLEQAWAQAMGEPECIPDYLRAAVLALAGSGGKE